MFIKKIKLKLPFKSGLMLLMMLSFLSSVAQENIIDPETHHKCVRTKKMFLGRELAEGSGLELWNGKLWSHNDSGTTALFAIDTLGSIVDTYDLPGVKNNDWEDLAQDDNYFYVGDIGNNLNDKNVAYVLRVDKQSLLRRRPVIDSIAFSWPEIDQDGAKVKINFDCEAMVKSGDSLYFFTKEWKKRRCTRLFSVPATPGKHLASYKATLLTRVLITGVSFDDKRKRLALCGYNLWAHPFLIVFDDTDLINFAPKKATKYRVRRCFRQVEGIAPDGHGGYFLVNEDLQMWFLRQNQQLHHIRLPR